MMVKRPVRDLRSDRPSPPRFCDVVIEKDGEVYLEKKYKDKYGKKIYEKIPWNDVVYQVEAAKTAAKNNRNYRK